MVTKDHEEDAYEYSHAEAMFIKAMTKINHFSHSHLPQVRIGFEVGLAYQYYEQIIRSRYLTSTNNPNRKMVLSLCKEYDKYLDAILPLRKILKEVD
jgi:hypothetical protein